MRSPLAVDESYPPWRGLRGEPRDQQSGVEPAAQDIFMMDWLQQKLHQGSKVASDPGPEAQVTAEAGDSGSGSLRKPRAGFQDEYCKSVKYILWLTKLIGKISFCVGDDGFLKLKYISWEMLYCVTLYAVLSFFAYQNIRSIVNNVIDSGSSFNSILFSCLAVMLVSNHFYLPFAFIFEWPCFISYLNNWKRYQTKLATVVSSECRGAHILVKVLVILSVPVVFVLSWFNTDTLNINKTYMSQYAVCFMQYLMIQFYWVFTNYHIRLVECLLRAHLNKTLATTSGRVRAESLSVIRDLWLDLAKLCQDLGYAMSTTMLITTCISSTAFIATCYVLILAIRDGAYNKSTLGFFLINMICVLYLILVTESAHRTTQSVGSDFGEPLMKHQQAYLDPATAQEINLFLQVIALNQPIIKIGGFITINRGVCVSLVSNTVTYLIVLVQFGS